MTSEKRPSLSSPSQVDISRLVFECQQIEHAHQQWLQALDAIPDPILLHDPEGRIIRVNRAYAEKAGTDYADLIGKPYWAFFPQLEGPLPECHAIANGENYRSRDIHLDRGEAFRLFAYAVRNPENGQRYGFHIFRDISELVRNQREQEKNEAFFSALAQTASDPVLVMDAEGKLAYWNQAAETTFGYSTEEALGQPLHSLLAGESYQEAYKAGLRHFLETGEGPMIGKTLELEARDKAGTSFPVELSVSAVQLPEGWYALGILRDITERKTQERRLQRTTWYLRALVQAHSSLVRAGEEGTLFQTVCQDLTGEQGYPLAWVGIARDNPEREVTVAGAAGERVDYLKEVAVTWDDGPTGQGPTGRAIRLGQTQVAHDLPSHPKYAPWREAARARGLNASLALPLQVEGETLGALNVYAREFTAFDDEERALLEGLAEDIAFGVRALRTRQERDKAQQALQQALVATVEAIARMVERRDPYTAGHQKRVAELSRAIGERLGLSPDRLKGLYLAGLIHDVGKISIPAEILNRPGKLSDKEFALIKDHARAGYEILQDVDFPWPVQETILQHHERQDGSGYPQGLSGEDLILEAQILGVADVVEAVCAHRPYRPALGIEAGLGVIQEGRGTQFNPRIVDTCVALFREEGFHWADVDAEDESD